MHSKRIQAQKKKLADCNIVVTKFLWTWKAFDSIPKPKLIEELEDLVIAAK